MSNVIVFGMPQSTYVRSLRMACEEKGAAHTVEPMMPDKMRDSGRHPFARMPAMEHDGVRLFESSAIIRYLDRAFDGPALEPADPMQALFSMQWESAAPAPVGHADSVRHSHTDVHRPAARAHQDE